MTDFTGTSGNDTLKGTGKADVFDMSQGGDDVVSGGGGDDEFDFGAAFTAADRVNGGAGSDTLVLAGDYSAGLVLGASTLTAVEEIDLTGKFNYALTTNDANVAAGQTLNVNASDLGGGNHVYFNGSHETDGAFDITVQDARAVLIGGAGADTFELGDRLSSGLHGQGGPSGDVLTGGGGADHFVFLSLARAGGTPNEITDLNNADVIDISNIDADIKTDGDQAFTLVSRFTHHAGQAVLVFDPVAGKTTLEMDVNGDAKVDYAIVLDGDHHDFTNFVL